MTRLTIATLFLSPLLSAQLKPTLSRPLVEGQKKIAAAVHQSGKWIAKIYNKEKEEQITKTLDITSSDPGRLTFDFANEPKLLEGVKKDWVVKLFRGAETDAVDEVTVIANSVKIFLHPPKEGDQVVKGTVLGTADQVRVEVFNAQGNPIDMDTASVGDGTTDDPGKHFTAGMNRRLAAGQTVRVTAMKADAEVGATTDFAMVETAGFDWGRVRSYFSAGVTIAHDDTTSTVDGRTTRDRQFQSADYFVSMNVDYNWLTSLKDRFAAPCLRPTKAVEELKQLEDIVDRWDGHDFKKQIGGFSNPKIAASRLDNLIAQLSKVLESAVKDLKSANDGQNCLAVEAARIQILETARASLPSALTDQQKASLDTSDLEKRIAAFKDAIDRLDKDLEEFRKGDPTVPRGGRLLNTSFEARLGQAPVAGATTIANPGSILQNSNSGYVGIDVYAPWWSQSNSWRFKDTDNALFFAPLVRLGLLATSNGPVDIVDENEKPALFRHLYGSHSYGVRFGHFKLDPRGQSVAPELISFLDVTVGKFDNFRLIKGDAPSTTDVVPVRTEFTGRFKIPETPIYVGFTANLGRGKDDMRFFFGTRFDISKVLSKLVPPAN